MTRIGVWLIGVQGSLAATVVLGARAIARRLAAGGGFVTELRELAPLRLVGVDDLVFGGWDIAPTGLVVQARTLAADDAAVPEPLITKVPLPRFPRHQNEPAVQSGRGVTRSWPPPSCSTWYASRSSRGARARPAP